jgi:energy-coupling factor transporter transmembrane protein EcfT
MSARTRVLLAIGAVLAAVALPPRGGLAIATLAIGAIAFEGVTARAWRAFRTPWLTVVIAVALQAWLAGRGPALALGARVAGATCASAWLLATTRPDQVIAVLRELRLPAAICELLALAARYVSVLGERLRTAREAQRVRHGWHGLAARLRCFGTLGGVVIVRAVDQSVVLAEAMRVRGGGR